MSTQETRRQTLRLLIKGTLILYVVSIAADLFWPLPDAFERAVNEQWESMPQRKFWIGLVLSTGLTACGLFGFYKLWHFRGEGLVYLAVSVFLPPFLLTPLSTAYTPVGHYFSFMGDVWLGMLFFLCWTQPDVLEPEAIPSPPAQSTG